MSPSRKRPPGYFEQKWAELRRLADERRIRTHKGGDPRVTRFVDALRGSLPAGDEDVPLRRAARMALIDASLAFMVYDWLMLTRPGAAAARAALDPFRGFAPLPDEE